MKYMNDVPKVNCINNLNNFSQFLRLGQDEFCDFLVDFLNLEEVRIQVNGLDVLKDWLKVDNLDVVMEVPERDDEICVVSQIQINGDLISYFPYVLKGRYVKIYFKAKSFLTKLSEAISDQISLCYLQGFKGGDWMFGEILARMIVANCISEKKYDGIKFAHLIEKMEQMAVSTFEGEFFPTGVIISSDFSKYKDNYFEFKTERDINYLDKREWFLANGQESFFLVDSSCNTRGIYRKSMPSLTDFISRYFDEYYLSNDLKTPDFIVRTVGPNEISVSDADHKEFVKIENVWRYRHPKNMTQFLVEHLHIEYKVSYAILYYTLKCSRNHISSILWIPMDSSEETIKTYTTSNRVNIWKKKLNLLDESHQVILEKILASDGAIVIEKNGQVLYESVFAAMKEPNVEKAKLVGSGETAARFLAKNGVAIKISQDGMIKVFAGNEKIYY
ncbi:hypothetical protein QMP26_13875 [Enterocloster clostridioformis]|uniref:hypothetical protein n=2 Tax=Enterocloster clostridioformis TaxID=1531 RepID=UPI0026766D87|nr:hypothetical protein [Enterocloster clostridioformis]